MVIKVLAFIKLYLIKFNKINFVILFFIIVNYNYNYNYEY